MYSCTHWLRPRNSLAPHTFGLRIQIQRRIHWPDWIRIRNTGQKRTSYLIFFYDGIGRCTTLAWSRTRVRCAGAASTCCTTWSATSTPTRIRATLRPAPPRGSSRQGVREIIIIIDFFLAELCSRTPPPPFLREVEERAKASGKKKGSKIVIVIFSTLLHRVGGCWDRIQECCDFGIGSLTL